MSSTPALFEPMPAGTAIGPAFIAFSEVRSARRSTALVFAVGIAALCAAMMLVAAVLLVA